jgi:hypothetical protein
MTGQAERAEVLVDAQKRCRTIGGKDLTHRDWVFHRRDHAQPPTTAGARQYVQVRTPVAGAPPSPAVNKCV